MSRPSHVPARAAAVAANRQIWPFSLRPLVLLGVFGLLSLSYLALPSASEETARLDVRCEGLDRDASQAVARLVRDQDEVVERQLGDAIFRLRRARKNCRIGWLDLARQDYEALLDGRYGGRP
jgi:hypothetical protein